MPQSTAAQTAKTASPEPTDHLWRSNRKAAAYVFLAVMLVYPIPWHLTEGITPILESLKLGHSLAFHGSFSDPFIPISTGPSAHIAPGYPLIVAAIIKLFGAGTTGEFVLLWLAKIVVACQLALLPILADYLGLRAHTGVIAAVVWLIAGLELTHWEGDFAALIVVLLAFPMYKSFSAELETREVILTAALWGVLLLFTPVPLLTLVVWLLCLALLGKQSRWKLGVIGVITIIIISPWLIRNYYVFHRPVFLRDNLGLELAVSNNNCAQFSIALNNVIGGCFPQNHPNENLREAMLVRAMGEPQYNEVRLRQAITWIGENQRKFISLTTERFLAFWFPGTLGGPPPATNLHEKAWVCDVITLLSIPGMILLWRKHRYAVLLFAGWLLLLPPIYYLIQFDPRYRHPVLWATLLPGAFCISELLAKIVGITRSRNTSQRSPQLEKITTQ